VQTAPARSVVTTAAGDQGGPQSVTLNTSLYQLQLDITPAASGDNELHLYAYTPAGAPLKVLEWKGTAGQPAAGIDPIAITFLPLTDSHATGQIDLPATGTWQFNLTLRTSDVDEATVTTTFKIS
jgi:copper transport protein